MNKTNINNKKEKFDPKALNAFDKVLVRNFTDSKWTCNIFSHIRQIDGYMCIYSSWRYCIPYNNGTKHLVDTEEEAPEYYRYWED